MALEFYPVDYDDDSVGFVAVEPEFEPWLIAAVGVSFEDISYSVLEEDEVDGLVELIIDGEDFGNLQDLYSEYELYGWSVIEDDDYAEWAEAFSAENKRYRRGINLDRFKGNRSNKRNFSKTRRELKQDMFGSVSMGPVLVGLGIIGAILLANRK
jgi:hypothetical protein|tara:strand:+ start:4250 stop:4714 length:465 start_codon:yes stop_codon:yes gene_type:complete